MIETIYTCKENGTKVHEYIEFKAWGESRSLVTHLHERNKWIFINICM